MLAPGIVLDELFSVVYYCFICGLNIWTLLYDTYAMPCYVVTEFQFTRKCFGQVSGWLRRFGVSIPRGRISARLARSTRQQILHSETFIHSPLQLAGQQL